MFCKSMKRVVVAIALALALVPAYAFADEPLIAGSDDTLSTLSVEKPVLQSTISSSGSMLMTLSDKAQVPDALDLAKERSARLNGMIDALQEVVTKKFEKANYTIPFDRADIDAIGNQAASGHTICCPSYSCAYADAVMDGTVNDHSYYTCNSCTWPNWGGGGSSFRNAGYGTPQLREAYDQISQGRPVVIHVGGVSGEHWIALIGYKNATNPDDLTLSNFIALDPWDGAQITAGSKYSLYGDGCQHISSR